MEGKSEHRACAPPAQASTAKEESPMNNTVVELTGIEEDWGRAMIQNDAEAIGDYMANDWVI